jgi:hypothetical protein
MTNYSLNFFFFPGDASKSFVSLSAVAGISVTAEAYK